MLIVVAEDNFGHVLVLIGVAEDELIDVFVRVKHEVTFHIFLLNFDVTRDIYSKRNRDFLYIQAKIFKLTNTFHISFVKFC